MAAQAGPKSETVNTMFAGIAKRYDCANHVLSGGIDFYWRWRLVRAVQRVQPHRVVDLATGSGDVAFALRRKLDADVSITGMDFCPEMLETARKKQTKRKGTGVIDFIEGDCLALPFKNASIDALTIAFGLRNLENRIQGLAEMHRVLKPGGSLFVLEFSQPDIWLRPGYFVYLKGVLPLVARMVTGNRSAYEYLGGSIESFPSKRYLSDEIKQTGFKDVYAQGLTGSIVAIHHAQV